MKRKFDSLQALKEPFPDPKETRNVLLFEDRGTLAFKRICLRVDSLLTLTSGLTRAELKTLIKRTRAAVHGDWGHHTHRRFWNAVQGTNQYGVQLVDIKGGLIIYFSWELIDALEAFLERTDG